MAIGARRRRHQDATVAAHPRTPQRMRSRTSSALTLADPESHAQRGTMARQRSRLHDATWHPSRRGQRSACLPPGGRGCWAPSGGLDTTGAAAQCRRTVVSIQLPSTTSSMPWWPDKVWRRAASRDRVHTRPCAAPFMQAGSPPFCPSIRTTKAKSTRPFSARKLSSRTSGNLSGRSSCLRWSAALR